MNENKNRTEQEEEKITNHHSRRRKRKRRKKDGRMKTIFGKISNQIVIYIVMLIWLIIAIYIAFQLMT